MRGPSALCLPQSLQFFPDCLKNSLLFCPPTAFTFLHYSASSARIWCWHAEQVSYEVQRENSQTGPFAVLAVLASSGQITQAEGEGKFRTKQEVRAMMARGAIYEQESEEEFLCTTPRGRHLLLCGSQGKAAGSTPSRKRAPFIMCSLVPSSRQLLAGICIGPSWKLEKLQNRSPNPKKINVKK